MRETLAAIRHLEQAVVDAGGIALRYGGFYGSPDDAQLELVRKRRFPIVGDGGGVWSFVHLDDAAAATVLALEQGAPGHLQRRRRRARAGARVAAGAGRRRSARSRRGTCRAGSPGSLAGEAGVVLMTEIRGASNAKAKRELGWTLRYPSWRQGFPAAYSPAAA